DVRLREKRERRRRVLFEVDGDRLLARVQLFVPVGRAQAQRVAALRLDADDSRAELEQLTRGERARQGAREGDNQEGGERCHVSRGRAGEARAAPAPRARPPGSAWVASVWGPPPAAGLARERGARAGRMGGGPGRGGVPPRAFVGKGPRAPPASLQRARAS